MKRVITLGLAIILCLLLVLPSNSYATGTAIKDYFEYPDSTLKFENISSQIYVALRTFGLVLAICILVTISISYMVATPNKRAVLKERLVYYVAGVVFLIGGIGFLGTYEKIVNNVKDGVNQTSSLQTPSLAKSIAAVEDACKLPKGDIRKMPMGQLEGFINELDYAISDVKLNVANGVNYPAGIDAKSLEDCAEKLEFARGIFNTLSENAKKDPEKVREDAY